MPQEQEHVEEEQTEQTQPPADEGQEAPEETPESEQPSQGDNPGQVEGTSGDGSGEGGGQPEATWNAREYAEKQLGFQGISEQFQSDEDFITALAQHRNQVYQQLQQREQELAFYRQQIQQQQQPPQPKAEEPPAKKKLFDPPEYDPRWEAMIVQDPETNKLSVKDGYDPTILQKYHAYHDYRRTFADKLFSDFEGTLAPFVEERAQPLVERIVEERIQKQQEQQQAQQFIQTNSAWLHARDQSGNVVYDPRTGQPVLSVAGQRFAQHLTIAEQRGIPGYQAQVEYARMATERDFLAEQYTNSQNKAKGEQQKQQALQRGNRKPNRNGSLLGGTPGHRGTPQNEHLPLRDQLSAAFKQHGITDADFQD